MNFTDEYQEKIDERNPEITAAWKQIYDKAPRYVCTNCNHLYNNIEYKYCPFCGAKIINRIRKKEQKKGKK